MKGLIILIIVVPLLVFLIFRKRKRAAVALPENFRELLNEHVTFYRQLNDEDKLRFEDRIKDFLSYVRIHGVHTEIDEVDKLLVASSAVIPTFGFDWHYHNLRDVLLYPDRFNATDFSLTGHERNALGMIGTGPMQRMMILSRPALRESFRNETSPHHVGIHEFVHLLDKADGETDGMPTQLLSRQYTIPWIKYMSEEIEKIKAGNSDINIYGASSRGEFFAVAAEYFFSAPERFKNTHPELFELMEKIFHHQSSKN